MQITDVIISYMVEFFVHLNFHTNVNWTVIFVLCLLHNFNLHYRSDKGNVEVDALSRIPWKKEGTLQTSDAVILKQ